MWITSCPACFCNVSDNALPRHLSWSAAKCVQVWQGDCASCRSSYLHGHVLEALTRNLITSLIVLIVAVILGYCPAFDPGGWLLALALLICVILVFSWLAIIVGLLARSEEGASALSALAIILPYLSSGFVPAAAMPGPLAFFAQVQPLTPITEVIRGALLGLSADPRMIMLAFGWCALLFIGFRLCGNRLLRHALSTQ